jgi:hypothetical protein
LLRLFFNFIFMRMYRTFLFLTSKFLFY